jgi:prepilin-type N-terminal cleavage/methylation domain-containing protein
MNKKRSGFTLIEIMIVVAVIAVLTGVGFNYYQDSLVEARVNTVKLNLDAVSEAISRYFKDHMTYPTSINELKGPYLQQSVQELLLTPLQPLDSNVRIEIKVSNVANENVYHVEESNTIWSSNLTGGKQFKDAPCLMILKIV